MSAPDDFEQKKALLQKIPDGYLFYPIFFVDDELANIGSAEYYEVLYAVRSVLGEDDTEN